MLAGEVALQCACGRCWSGRRSESLADGPSSRRARRGRGRGFYVGRPSALRRLPYLLMLDRWMWIGGWGGKILRVGRGEMS